MKLALISPNGPLYRHRGGILKKSLRYQPLTLTTPASLLPQDLHCEVRLYDEGIEDVPLDLQADLVGMTVITGTARRVYDLGAADRLLIAVAFVAAATLPLLYTFTTALSFADHSRADWIGWSGALVMVAGIWLYRSSMAALGPHWSGWLHVHVDHELVWVRHPLYVAIVVYGLGQTLLLSDWLAGPSTLLAAALFLLIRAPREEALLREVFGERYREYARRTPPLPFKNLLRKLSKQD